MKSTTSAILLQFPLVGLVTGNAKQSLLSIFLVCACPVFFGLENPHNILLIW